MDPKKSVKQRLGEAFKDTYGVSNNDEKKKVKPPEKGSIFPTKEQELTSTLKEGREWAITAGVPEMSCHVEKKPNFTDLAAGTSRENRGNKYQKDEKDNVNSERNLYENVGGASNASASNSEQINSQVNPISGLITWFKKKFPCCHGEETGSLPPEKIQQEHRDSETHNGAASSLSLIPEDIMNNSASQNQRQARLSTKITEIPLPVYGELCVELNVKRNLKFDDFRMLAQKVGIKRNAALSLEQRSNNPTDDILQSWSTDREATVEKLIELLKQADFGREDVAEILEKWVNGS